MFLFAFFSPLFLRYLSATRFYLFLMEINKKLVEDATPLSSCNTNTAVHAYIGSGIGTAEKKSARVQHPNRYGVNMYNTCTQPCRWYTGTRSGLVAAKQTCTYACCARSNKSRLDFRPRLRFSLGAVQRTSHQPLHQLSA